MEKNNLIYWKEKLKEDLYYVANLKLYMYHFHDETNGISIKKGDFTKTFKKWLLKQSIGEILLEEIERRKEVNIKCLTPKIV